MKQRILLFGALLATAGTLVVLGYWLLTPTPGVTKANCERLHPGMTYVHVEVLLGNPAYTEDNLRIRRARWVNGDTDVALFFYKDQVSSGGWVSGSEFGNVCDQKSIWQRLIASVTP